MKWKFQMATGWKFLLAPQPKTTGSHSADINWRPGAFALAGLRVPLSTHFNRPQKRRNLIISSPQRLRENPKDSSSGLSGQIL